MDVRALEGKKQIARTVTNKTYLRLLYFIEFGKDEANLTNISEQALQQKRQIRIWLTPEQVDFLNQIQPPHKFGSGRPKTNTFAKIAASLTPNIQYLIDTTAPVTPDNIDLSAFLAYYIKLNMPLQVVSQTISSDLLTAPVFTFKNIPPQYASCVDLAAVLAMVLK